MSEKEVLPNLEVMQELLEDCMTAKDESLAALAAVIRQASEAGDCWSSNDWILVRNSLNKIAEKLEPEALSAGALELLEAAFQARVDAPILRDRYAALAKHEFSGYRDPAGLDENLGIRSGTVALEEAAERWKMLAQLRSGALVYDKDLNPGRVIALDDTANEVQMQFERRKNVPLQVFFRDYIVIQDLSSLHSLLNGSNLPIRREGQDLFAELEGCLLHTGKLPNESLKKLLVPKIMNESHYNVHVMGEVEKAVAAKKAAPQSPATAHVAEVRWDESRTVLELSERLKNVSTLNVDGEVDKENVLRIFKFAAPRKEQAEKFALALAYMQSMAGSLEDWIADLARELMTEAVIWENKELWVEISDKMPGKMAPHWFEVTRCAAGEKFLASQTMKLPYRLWGYVEKLLASKLKGSTLLADTVADELATSRVSADLLYWLWRSKYKAIKDKYLSDSALIFKTLHQEAKGNYLKAQRDLRKLLLDDEDFQEQVMLEGDHSAVVELIRCTKRLPLLDPGERQSLLVKIVNLHPEFLSDVEEKHQGPIRINVGKLTSIRGYKKLVADLEDLVSNQIPENVKAIEHARSLGDLRENSEFKFAKERQGFLGRRRREWEELLEGMRTTDFTEVAVDKKVVPGCTVLIRYNDGREVSYSILGMLDSEPEKQLISYDTPLGKMLLGQEVGAHIVMPDGGKATLAEVRKLSPELMKYVAGK